MAWTYVQATGRVISPEGEVFAQGYSGHEHGCNNPAMQCVRDTGPIPCGRYVMGPLEDGGHMGPNVMRLIPDEGTRESIQKLGRDPDSFYIHGGLAGEAADGGTASHGCIVLGLWPRTKMGASAVRELAVVSGLRSS